ncbi:hypothetical protein DPQ22_02130 [Candidatus Tokpelaia sp.]|nr:hypothetical protein DPQ22_02130 [Candidatus Tokpelaia sp.]
MLLIAPQPMAHCQKRPPHFQVSPLRESAAVTISSGDLCLFVLPYRLPAVLHRAGTVRHHSCRGEILPL